MSEPDIPCDLCGLRLVNARMINEMFAAIPGDKNIGQQRHQRMFEGECPDHGHRFAAFPNEGHSTVLASRLAKRLTKAESRALWQKLSLGERKRFQLALRGQYAWDENDLERWRKVLAQ